MKIIKNGILYNTEKFTKVLELDNKIILVHGKKHFFKIKIEILDDDINPFMGAVTNEEAKQFAEDAVNMEEMTIKEYESFFSVIEA